MLYDFMPMPQHDKFHPYIQEVMKGIRGKTKTWDGLPKTDTDLVNMYLQKVSPMILPSIKHQPGCRRQAVEIPQSHTNITLTKMERRGTTQP